MVSWVSQEVVSSANAQARARTAYLAPLREDVEEIARRYLASNPTAEDVTLEVLSQLGRARIEHVRSGRSIDRAKQDMGLLIAQVLVDVYAPASVFTLRDEQGAIAGRRNTRQGIEWVAKYAPHRITLGATGQMRERIVIDTSCVRDFVSEDKNGHTIETLLGRFADQPISIADHAVAELGAALLRGSIRFQQWQRRAETLDQFLDPRFPVAPGGVERSAASGLVDHAVIEETTSAYHRAVWRHLRDARSASELKRPTIFEGANKQRFQISLEPERLEATIQQEALRWERFIDGVRAICAQSRLRAREQDIASVIRVNLGRDLSDEQLAKLDLPVRVLARRTVQATKRYKARGSNDPMDFDLLFYVGLPATVCTRDERLVRLVRETGLVTLRAS